MGKTGFVIEADRNQEENSTVAAGTGCPPSLSAGDGEFHRLRGPGVAPTAPKSRVKLLALQTAPGLRNYLHFILMCEGEGTAGTSEEIRKWFLFLQEILWLNFFNRFQLLHSEKILLF